MDVSGFPHQVGGHFGLLKCRGHVCKPLSQREFAFYLQIDKRLRPFTAKCCGRIKVNLCAFEDGSLHMCTDSLTNCVHIGARHVDNNCEPRQSTSNETTAVNRQQICGYIPTQHFPALKLPNQKSSQELQLLPQQKEKEPPMTFRIKCGKVEAEKATNLWAGQCQSKVVQKLLKGYDKWFMLLEDIVDDYRKPCVIDLKMGTRQYGDDASAQKRLTQTQKCRQSTSELMGVRMVGMQLYQHDPSSYVYVNKYEGRRMDRTMLYTALAKFFSAAGHERMLELVAQLQELQRVLKTAESFRFFSSSLLIAFDADDDNNDATEKEHIEQRQNDNFKNFNFDNIKGNIKKNLTANNTNIITPITEFSQLGADAQAEDESRFYKNASCFHSKNADVPGLAQGTSSYKQTASSPYIGSSTLEDSEDGESLLSTVSFSLECESTSRDSESCISVDICNVDRSDSTTTISSTSWKCEKSTMKIEDSNLTSEKIDKPRIVLKMIDFAHSTFDGFMNDECYKGIDEGYLLGIESLIEIVNEILSGHTIEKTKEILTKDVLHTDTYSKDEGIEADTEVPPIEKAWDKYASAKFNLNASTSYKAKPQSGQEKKDALKIAQQQFEQMPLQRWPSKRKMIHLQRDNRDVTEGDGEPMSCRQPPKSTDAAELPVINMGLS